MRLFLVTLLLILSPRSYALSWDTTEEHRQWSRTVNEMISGDLFEQFDMSQDSTRFCDKYATLDRETKIKMWSELIVWISYYESSWDRTSRMMEPDMGIDPATGLRVYSEGLLQMSYQDVRNYEKVLGKGWCGFDWARDQHLDATDPLKTILNARINLTCGIKVLARQIQKNGRIIYSNGYWSVLRDREGSKVYRIIDHVKRSIGCI